MMEARAELVKYRLARAKETLEDARLLPKNLAGIPPLTVCIMQPFMA
jgi:hypothetical protein